MKYLSSALPWMLLATGVIIGVLCGQRLLDRHRLQSDGRVTSGLVKWATTTGARSNQIEVVFRDARGTNWTKDFAVYSSQYQTGQSVDVVYLPANPQIAILGPREAGVTTTREAVGSAVGGVAIFISMAWLIALFRGRHARA